VARVIKPELVSCSEAQVEVELAGVFTRGMTVTDFRMRDGSGPNALVGTNLDADGFWDLFLDAIERLARPRLDATRSSSP
jgi:purine nucleosidase